MRDAVKWALNALIIYIAGACAVYLTAMVVAVGWIDGQRLRERAGAHLPRVFIDPATGCHYLQTGNALFVRMGTSGRPLCNPPEFEVTP